MLKSHWIVRLKYRKYGFVSNLFFQSLNPVAGGTQMVKQQKNTKRFTGLGGVYSLKLV